MGRLSNPCTNAFDNASGSVEFELYLAATFFIPLLNTLRNNIGGKDKKDLDKVPETEGLPLIEEFP